MTSKISILAIDLAKGSFQVCAVGPDGSVLYNRALSRNRLATLLVAAVALANKMPRMIWAMSTKQEDYRMA
jgi:hypothetical protein